MKMDDVKYHVIMGALHAVALLPLRVLYLFSDLFRPIVQHVVKYRRKVVRKNLQNAFPEKSPEELRQIEKRFYRYFCDCVVETVKLLHISDRQIKKRVTLENERLVYELIAQNRPIILFLGHYGNWEWVQSMVIMLREPKIMGALYKPLRSKVMDRVMLRIRSRFNLVCIPTRTAYRRLLEIRQTDPSFMIGFIADQRPSPRSIRNWTEFMGQEAAYSIGGETIGQRVDANYLYVEADRVRRGHLVLRYKKMEVPENDNGEYPYTRLFLRMLEETIRKEPAYWLWSHNRWNVKRKKED